MSDDKTKTGGGDRARVSASDTYEVDYFARKHDISRERAEQLIARHGNNRSKLDEAAEALKG